MILAVDVGNSNVSFGLWDGQSWRGVWRAQTVPDKTADEYAVLLRGFFDMAGVPLTVVGGVVVASVVPPLTRSLITLTEKYLNCHALIVNADTPTGLKIDLDTPGQVGADRIANALAAWTLYGAPAIVVDFGTATNCEVISGDGAFIGGAIAPGLNLMVDTLARNTAQLPRIPLAPPPSPIGRNTAHALQSGVFLGYVGLIEGLVSRMKAAFSPAEREQVKIIGTGGLVTLIAPHTRVLDEIAETLTLDGLRLIWEHNQSSRDENR